jgi:hypothetical protein
MRSKILARVFSGEGMINFLSSQSPLELLRQASLLQNPLAVWRDLILLSTEKRRFVMGLYHISWSPLPCLSR